MIDCKTARLLRLSAMSINDCGSSANGGIMQGILKVGDDRRKQEIGRIALKLIALISMIIDHIGHAILAPYVNTNTSILVWYCVSRSIGRIAFPLYAFMLAEGIHHTHDLRKYACRLWIFAVASELPYDYMNGFHYYLSIQNVGFTLALGATAEYFSRQYPKWKYGIWLIAAELATLCGTDYGGFGIFVIFALTMKNEWVRLFAIGVIMEQAFYALYGLTWMNFASALACVFAVEAILRKYNPDTRMSRIARNVFYLGYPVHMVLCGAVKNLLTCW